MKKILNFRFIAPAFGMVLAAAFLWCGHGFAMGDTLILDGDNPSNIGGSTKWGGSLREAGLTVINFFLYFLGLLCTGMVIYGGYLYITAGGDDGQTEKAKKVLMYAVIGILICLLSFAIVNSVTQMGGGSREET